MRINSITLETAHFEDYLSFMTEVLELDLTELSEEKMSLDMQGTTLIIKKCLSAAYRPETEIEFALETDDYQAMMNKISFFYYRKGPTRFLLTGHDDIKCNLIDPDGRSWRFSRCALKQPHFLNPEHISKKISLLD